MTRSALKRRCHNLISRLSDGQTDDDARDALLVDLAHWQATKVPTFRALQEASNTESVVAMPTDVFRHARVAAHPEAQDARVFHSSGTTASHRSRHAFRTLDLYDAAAEAAAKHMLFDATPMRMVVLAPHTDDAPQSSLGYMLTRFSEWFAADAVWAWKRNTIQPEVLRGALRQAIDADEPVAIMGTSFAFVHAEDALNERFALPSGSMVLHTGGFKGQSRTVEPAALNEALAARYSVDPAHVRQEYGMTELSSQLYDVPGNKLARVFAAPGWMRVSVVDPETLRPLSNGEVGIIRIDDCANLDSVCAIQTSDLGRMHGRHVEVLGRSPGAVPRGCSLAADMALGAAP